METDFARMAEAMERYIDSPHIFVRQVLDVSPDRWQEEALQAIGTHSRVAIRSGHGVGKTALEAFDRLEVAEATAQSIIDAHDIGEIQHITEGEIADLKKAFNLGD